MTARESVFKDNLKITCVKITMLNHAKAVLYLTSNHLKLRKHQLTNFLQFYETYIFNVSYSEDKNFGLYDDYCKIVYKTGSRSSV